MNDMDINKIRDRFPLLNNRKTIYLDNAATVQKPQCVLDAVNDYYLDHNANPMRGLYDLSLEATDAYEEARSAVAGFIGADADEIVFTRNASESLNLVAYSYGLHNINQGDELIVSVAEHHSNFLPWINIAKITGAKVVFWDCAHDGRFDLDDLDKLITDKTRLIAITHVSNVIGRINDIKAITAKAHEKGVLVVCDGAQAVPHIAVDVKNLDVDFYAFSGHKMYAPMGIGALYGKRSLLEELPPFLHGGEMIETVTKERVTFAEVPHKFEAGTVNAGGAIGFGAAVRFMEETGIEAIAGRESELTEYAFDGMKNIPHIEIIGSENKHEHHGIIAFKVDGVHPHDVAAIFSDEGIAIRAGHHCAQPLHKHIGIMSSTRASFAFYNTYEEIDAFLKVLSGIRSKMGINDD